MQAPPRRGGCVSGEARRRRDHRCSARIRIQRRIAAASGRASSPEKSGCATGMIEAIAALAAIRLRDHGDFAQIPSPAHGFFDGPGRMPFQEAKTLPETELESRLLEMVAILTTSPPRRISAGEVRGWTGNMGEPEFFNGVGVMVARKFQQGALGYSICDAIMNDLWRAWLENGSNGEMAPSPFYDIFEAFDAGEHHRAAGRSDDPVEDFTIPMIDDILRETPSDD